MGVLDVPKAILKAQQAKKKMSKIEVVGTSGAVNVLINGVNEVKEVEIDVENLKELFKEVIVDTNQLEKIAKKLSEDIKQALNDGKKKLEKQLISSTDLDELKSLLGGG